MHSPLQQTFLCTTVRHCSTQDPRTVHYSPITAKPPNALTNAEHRCWLVTWSLSLHASQRRRWKESCLEHCFTSCTSVIISGWGKQTKRGSSEINQVKEQLLRHRSQICEASFTLTSSVLLKPQLFNSSSMFHAVWRFPTPALESCVRVLNVIRDTWFCFSMRLVSH